MTLINCRDLGVILGASLFSGLNFSLAAGDRIGLVAANGRGKSTLLRCLAGSMEPTSGEITRARGLRIAYVEQNVPQAYLRRSLHDTVLSALPAESMATESWRVDIVLDDLAIPDDLRGKLLSELSGGWQRVALLARAWVGEPDVLLMDEPTNHLDLTRIAAFEKWIATTARAAPMIIASHDRAFLDTATNRTLFLRETKSLLFALPYSRARAALDGADAADDRRFQNDMKQAKQLRRQAAKLKNIGINSGSDLLITKTKQLKERAEKLEGAAKPAYQARSAGAIRLANSGTHAKALLSCENAQVQTPDGRPLFKTGTIWINRGDRIVLLGANGSGKTQFVSLLHRAVTATVPDVKATPSLVLGYSDQGLTQLDGDASPLAAITHRFDIGDQRARALLAGAGIGVDLQTVRVQALSGGQKARLAMLVLRLRQPNFYLLDEPTNHLDIEGQEALQAELCAHEVTCLFVSHDRTFIRETANRFWLIEGRKLVEVEDPDGFFAAAFAR